MNLRVVMAKPKHPATENRAGAVVAIRGMAGEIARLRLLDVGRGAAPSERSCDVIAVAGCGDATKAEAYSIRPFHVPYL